MDMDRFIRAMKLLAGYLERARQLEFLAGETKDDPRFKRMLLRQVVAYRMLAVKRADKLHLPRPTLTALRTARRKNRIELRVQKYHWPRQARRCA